MNRISFHPTNLIFYHRLDNIFILMRADSSNSKSSIFLNNLFNPSGNFDSAWWCQNGHWHTIAGNFLGNKKLPGNTSNYPSNRRSGLSGVNMTDSGPDSPVVILLHGLEGSSHSYYIAELANELVQKQFSFVALNFRGCGPHMNRQRRFYHSGETGDFNTVVQWARNTFPDRPILAVGYSLGANVLLKWLGEQKQSAFIEGGIAVSAPFDLGICSDSISLGFNKVYEQYFMLSLKRKLKQKKRIFPDMPDFNGSTLRDFDDQVTSVLHGFKNADDYYKRASSAAYIDDIEIPALIIHSKEDPICPFEAVPAGSISQNSNIETIITQKGGHVGFLGSDRRWLNKTIIEYLEWISTR